MGLPKAVEEALTSLDPTIRRAFRRDYRRRRRSLVVAYAAWLLLGWHYLYLGRVGVQFAFWFTGGGLLVWWAVDALRLPGLVARANEDTARALMAEYRAITATASRSGAATRP